MAYTTINKSTDYFNTKLYTGTGSSNAITGVGFQPDWVWFKGRSVASDHKTFDAVRGGPNNLIQPNSANAQVQTSYFSSINSDGFTVTGSDNSYNASNATYASWNWKANGQGSANTDGSINSTYTSANTTSGFSIVQYTGTGSGATVGHGLGVKPKIIFFKNLDSGTNWVVQSTLLANRTQLVLNGTDAQNTDSRLGNLDSWSNSVFSLGTYGDMNGNGNSHIAYCFAEKQGYSKFGSYIGNDNGNGPFIYTGFKPAFVMIKRKDGTGNWSMIDNKRPSFNECNNTLKADLNSVEYTATDQSNDMLSNGFKIRNNADNFNVNNSTYIYMAFAEAPLVGTNNVPCTAR